MTAGTRSRKQDLNRRRREILREGLEDLIGRSVRYQQLRDRGSALETETLRGHLFLEELLWELIVASLPNPAYLEQRQFSFYEKALLARAMSEEPSHGAWDLLFTLNELRNDLAHQLDSRKRPGKVAKLRRLYTPYISPNRLPEDQLVIAVVDDCMKFLALGVRGATANKRWAELLKTSATD